MRENRKKKTLTDTVIRAAGLLPKPSDDGNLEIYALPQSELLVLRLFGDAPDYTKRKYERLWQRVLKADDDSIVAWCLKRGVDVLDDAGHPVPGWRDIAVMLKAISRGYLKLDKENKP